MEELRKFYISSLTTMALVVALAVYAIPTHLIPLLMEKLGSAHWSVFVSNLFTSRLAIVVILGVGEWLIRKKLWKWIHPELDLTGMWIGDNTYTHVHVGAAPVGGTSGEHEVKIEQDCLSIRIAPSEGTQFGFWESKAIELADKHKLVYAYEVHYAKHVPNRPEKAFGYEEMTLLHPDGAKRPSRMKGNFYQCVAGQTPVFSGTVVFERIK
jgi:hypothetical protein